MQILYSYFRYTGRLFLGCALFVARCNTIRTSWETKKERLSYRKKYIEEFVWGISLFWLHALSMSFCCFLCLLPPTFQVTWLRNGPCSLGKAIDSYWFKMSCLSFLVFICLHCFFLKMMKLFKDICSAWMSRTSVEIFFL